MYRIPIKSCNLIGSGRIGVFRYSVWPRVTANPKFTRERRSSSCRNRSHDVKSSSVTREYSSGQGHFFPKHDYFVERHVGPDISETHKMLEVIGVKVQTH